MKRTQKVKLLQIFIFLIEGTYVIFAALKGEENPESSTTNVDFFD